MKAAIFDMDGTLVETLDLHIQAYVNVSKKHNMAMGRDFIKIRFGMTAKEIFREFAEQNEIEVDCDALAQEKYEEFDKIAQEIPTLPGAIELLDKLKNNGTKIALASGSGRPNVNSVLQRSEIGPYFPITVAGDEVPRGKEFPDIWIESATRLGLTPDEFGECVVFEDSANGAQSAKDAGMIVVGVLTGYSTFEDLEAICDYLLNDLTEFENVFDQI